MAIETYTVYAVIGGRRVPVTATHRTGPDLQLIAGAKVLASVDPNQREKVMGGARFDLFHPSPIGSRFD